MGEHHCDPDVKYLFSRKELLNLLNAQFGDDEYHNMTLKTFEDELDKIYASDEQIISPHSIVYDFEKNKYYSISPTYSFECHLSIFFRRNSAKLISSIVILSCLLLFWMKKSYEKYIMSQAEELYKEIIYELGLKRVLRVKELYSKWLEKVGKQKLQIIWSVVERLRIERKQIALFKDEYNGNIEIFWKLQLGN